MLSDCLARLTAEVQDVTTAPVERSEACVVRHAKAVPTWQKVMPAKVMVVAVR